MKNKNTSLGGQILRDLSWRSLNYTQPHLLFSQKKRVESGIAFIIAEWGMVFFLLKKYPDLTMTDIIMWASIQFTISGYILHQIQKEKKNGESPTVNEEDPTENKE